MVIVGRMGAASREDPPAPLAQGRNNESAEKSVRTDDQRRSHGGLKATLNKWRNCHDTGLRADSGALTQMDGPSFKAAQQRSARKQASPHTLFSVKRVALRRAAIRTARLTKATSVPFATQHEWRAFSTPWRLCRLFSVALMLGGVTDMECESTRWLRGIFERRPAVGSAATCPRSIECQIQFAGDAQDLLCGPF